MKPFVQVLSFNTTRAFFPSIRRIRGTSPWLRMNPVTSSTFFSWKGSTTFLLFSCHQNADPTLKYLTPTHQKLPSQVKGEPSLDLQDNGRILLCLPDRQRQAVWLALVWDSLWKWIPFSNKATRDDSAGECWNVSRELRGKFAVVKESSSCLNSFRVTALLLCCSQNKQNCGTSDLCGLGVLWINFYWFLNVVKKKKVRFMSIFSLF